VAVAAHDAEDDPEKATADQQQAGQVETGGGAGVLGEDAMGRVLGTVREYREVIESEGAERAVAVLTSAVRDAANGDDFLARVRAEGGGLDARVIAGDEEARLTFRGATSERARGDATPTLVIDVGGGSTRPGSSWLPRACSASCSGWSAATATAGPAARSWPASSAAAS